MHKGLKRETAQEKPLSSGATKVMLWDSVESDTESLAQERADQMQHHGEIIDCNNKDTGPQEEFNDSHDGEYLHVYDSLDEASNLYVKRSPGLLQRKHNEEREGASKLFPGNDYLELRYDPNWRRNPPAAAHFKESSQLSPGVLREKSSQTSADRQEVVIKGGYKYVIADTPAVVVTPPVAINESEQPYHLHPPAPSYSHRQQGAKEAHRSSPSSTKSEKHSSETGFNDRCENICDDESENTEQCPELIENKQTVCIKQFPTYRQQEGATHTCQASTWTNPKGSYLKKQERLTEDIVERNKMTLGRNKTGYGSYVKVHTLKQETPDPGNKVTQISSGRKTQWKENPGPPQKQEQQWGQGLSPPSTQPLLMSSSQALPPTIHVNISLNTSSLPQPYEQMGRETIISVASLHGCSLWMQGSQTEVAPSSGYQLASYKSSLEHSNPQCQSLKSSPEQKLRALKSPLSSERVEERRSPNEVHGQEVLLESLGTHTNNSYKVLPPIGKPQTGREAETSPGSIRYIAEEVPRSGSDSYLLQMEKQKQRTRGNYKAYSLKDYKKLKLDINLRGLGPDYKVIEKTAEKLKRQKLYSNVIREQNSKISRIPFLPTKNLEDKNLPRMKALEYAKSISKPQVQCKLKQKDQESGPSDLAPYLADLDLFQTSALDVLRKRHEEEKQAVALFRKVHIV